MSLDGALSIRTLGSDRSSSLLSSRSGLSMSSRDSSGSQERRMNGGSDFSTKKSRVDKLAALSVIGDSLKYSEAPAIEDSDEEETLTHTITRWLGMPMRKVDKSNPLQNLRPLKDHPSFKALKRPKRRTTNPIKKMNQIYTRLRHGPSNKLPEKPAINKFYDKPDYEGLIYAIQLQDENDCPNKKEAYNGLRIKNPFIKAISTRDARRKSLVSLYESDGRVKSPDTARREDLKMRTYSVIRRGARRTIGQGTPPSLTDLHASSSSREGEEEAFGKAEVDGIYETDSGDEEEDEDEEDEEEDDDDEDEEGWEFREEGVWRERGDDDKFVVASVLFSLIVQVEREQ